MCNIAGICSADTEPKHRISMRPCNILFPNPFCDSNLPVCRFFWDFSFHPWGICLLCILHFIRNNCSGSLIFNSINIFIFSVMSMSFYRVIISGRDFYPEIISHIVICLIRLQKCRISCKRYCIPYILNTKPICYIFSGCSCHTGTLKLKAWIQRIL